LLIPVLQKHSRTKGSRIRSDLARLATAVPVTPGGVGVVEAVLIGGLVAAGGAKAEVVAAVLVFRALTWLLPIPVGVGTYLWWRKQSLSPATQEASDLLEVQAR